MSLRQDHLFFPPLLPFPSRIRGLIVKDRAQERTGSFSAAERRRTCRQSAGTRFAWVGAAGQVAHSGAASGLPLQTGWMRTTSASSPPVRPRPRALPSMLLPRPAALPPQPNGCTAWQLRGRPSVDSPVRPCQPPRPALGGPTTKSPLGGPTTKWRAGRAMLGMPAQVAVLGTHFGVYLRLLFQPSFCCLRLPFPCTFLAAHGIGNTSKGRPHEARLSHWHHFVGAAYPSWKSLTPPPLFVHDLLQSGSDSRTT